MFCFPSIKILNLALWLYHDISRAMSFFKGFVLFSVSRGVARGGTTVVKGDGKTTPKEVAKSLLGHDKQYTGVAGHILSRLSRW